MAQPPQISRRRAMQAAMMTAAAIPASTAVAREATPSPGGTPAVSTDRVQAALGKLDALFADAMSRTGVPGAAVAVVSNDEVVYEQGFGVREVGKPEEVTPDTVFQLASMSKALSSTLVAAVVGDGRISWDTVAADALPGFALSDPTVTAQMMLRDLFSHRSGLPAYAGDSFPATFGYGRDESVRRLRYVKQATPIRSAYAYTNLGLSVAGYAAAAAADAVWEDLADERLFSPLGMNATSYRYADYVARDNKAAPHYRKLDGTYALGDVTDADPTAPAGGASSTVRDLAQWMRLQLGAGRYDGAEIVARDALLESRRPQILVGTPPDPAAGPASFYGLGWFVDYDEQGRFNMHHIGDFSAGFRSGVYLRPDDGLGIVVLTNAWPNPLSDAVPKSFFELVDHGETTQDWIGRYAAQTDAGLDAIRQAASYPLGEPPAGEPPLELDAYTGTFANEMFGEITARTGESGLVLELGPGPVTLPLTHWSRDVFTYALPPSGAVMLGQLGVQFLIGPTGMATTLAFGLPTVGPDSVSLFARVPGPE